MFNTDLMELAYLPPHRKYLVSDAELQMRELLWNKLASIGVYKNKRHSLAMEIYVYLLPYLHYEARETSRINRGNLDEYPKQTARYVLGRYWDESYVFGISAMMKGAIQSNLRKPSEQK